MSTTRFILGSTSYWETLPVPLQAFQDGFTYWESRWLKRRVLMSRGDYYRFSDNAAFAFDGELIGEVVVGNPDQKMLAYLWK